MKRASVVFALLGSAACVVRHTVPSTRAHDARFGYFAGGSLPDGAGACGRWADLVEAKDPHAGSHTSFPDADPDRSCFTPIVHAGRTVVVGRVPPGCATPSDDERRAMASLADRLESTQTSSEVDALHPCTLSPAQRAAADRHNAAVLRAVSAMPDVHPYSAIIVPGFGNPAQARASMASWLPGDTCHGFADGDRRVLGAMVPRTRRASDAWHGGVAPVVLVTGGSPHSPMIEAFAMLYLLTCDPDAAAPHVLVEPCAEHTHTNLRNAGRWLTATAGRAAYLVTDDDFQADYFQDWTAFDLIGGSIDARSLRDWGYVIGSWRQASVGIEAGFWFSPFRFWAEPHDGLGSFTCVGYDRTR